MAVSRLIFGLFIIVEVVVKVVVKTVFVLSSVNDWQNTMISYMSYI